MPTPSPETPLPETEPSAGDIILGTDRAGDQVSIREKMRPMLALFVLMIEVLSMASLVSSEVLTRTVTAVLVTPAQVGDFLAAKTIYGTILAMSQAIIVLLAIGAFTAHNWPLLVLTMLVGSVMFTGVAMIVGSAGKDFIGAFYSMLFMLPLMYPAFAVLFPGTATAWTACSQTSNDAGACGRDDVRTRWADVWSSSWVRRLGRRHLPGWLVHAHAEGGVRYECHTQVQGPCKDLARGPRSPFFMWAILLPVASPSSSKRVRYRSSPPSLGRIVDEGCPRSPVTQEWTESRTPFSTPRDAPRARACERLDAGLYGQASRYGSEAGEKPL